MEQLIGKRIFSVEISDINEKYSIEILCTDGTTLEVKVIEDEIGGYNISTSVTTTRNTEDNK